MASLTAISLGWGVQSWGLAAMSALGKLPPVDVAIHADTGWERSETLVFARRWTPWLERRGVRVVTVHPDPRYVNAFDVVPLPTSEPQILIPAYQGYADGAGGLLGRQCTGHWKIRPIKRWIREHYDEPIEQWIGITLDEAHRARQSDVQYIVNRWPFLEMLDRPWLRAHVVHWLQEQELEVPPSSNCVICPYHTDLEWRRMKQAENDDWERAVAVDKAIRDKRPGYKCYLHSSRKPLEDVRLGIEQLEMW